MGDADRARQVTEQATAAAEALAYLRKRADETATDVDFSGWIKDLNALKEAAGNASDALLGLKRAAEEAADATAEARRTGALEDRQLADD